jgi:hypothetical protein
MASLFIECPCCHATLEIDAATGKVLSSKEFKKEKESLADFMEKQKHRTAELDAKFNAAKEKEKNRLSEIEKKFEAAKKSKNLKDPPPTINWD